jgi:hypothetical protein
MAEFVSGDRCQESGCAGVEPAIGTLDSIKEDVAILATAVFSQERLAKDRLAFRVAGGHNVQHKLIRSRRPPAIVQHGVFFAVHPRNFDACRSKQPGRFCLRRE